MNRELLDFHDHLPTAVLTTNDFDEGTKYRARRKVKDYVYCGLNTMYRAYLSFDIDKPYAAFRFDDLNLPTPTIITTNRANSRCHYLYRLVTPVAYHKAARAKPQHLYAAVLDAMTVALGADPDFSHTLTKNPFHSKWLVQTYPTSYHLTDFLEYVSLPSLEAWRLPKDVAIQGRNDLLFHTLRIWAYAEVRDYTHEERFQRSVMNEASSINRRIPVSLPQKEVDNTARCTARWVWRHRHSLPTRTRVLTFDNEDAKARMRAGAIYTNEQRQQKSKNTILNAACALYPTYGPELNSRIISECTGMNIKTVRKYLPEVLTLIHEAA